MISYQEEYSYTLMLFNFILTLNLPNTVTDTSYSLKFILISCHIYFLHVS